jgi:hypothetical protein
VKRARSILITGLFLALRAGGWAQAGLETFDHTGFGSGNTWVAGGAFTGQQDVVWTYANARGVPPVRTGDPAMVLRGNPKGWLASEPLTGGVGRVTATFMQAAATNTDCDVRINGTVIGNYRSAGVSGVVETVSISAFDPVARLPFTNDFVLSISNRVASAGVVALDDLAWEPFRLFVRLDQTGTNRVYAGREFDVVAEVFDLGQGWTGGWAVPPGFAGTVSDTNDPHLTVIPAAADIGQVHVLIFTAVEEDGEGATHSARIDLEVLEAPDPRFVDFEGASFGYNTNAGVVTNLNGLNWNFFNVRTSDATDRRLDATSARFRHQTGAPAAMESLDPFDGIGTLSLHYAHYQADRTVLFAVQVRTDGEEAWNSLPDGTFNVAGHNDITNSVFAVDVQRSEPLYVRLVTTGNANELANIDNVRIRPYGDTLPRLAWSGPAHAPVGWETHLDFTLLNAAGIVREWEHALDPPNPHGSFEVTLADQLRFRFAPTETNEWGEYAVTATARIGGEIAGTTTVTVRVVSPPGFTLAPVATNIVVPGIVDIWVTNVALHDVGTNWATAWSMAPAFANPPSVNDRRRYRIAAGTTEADAGVHTATAVLTDLGTGVSATGSVILVVSLSGGGSGEVYPILAFDIHSHLVVSGRAGRVYQPFGTTNLNLGAGEAAWTWRGTAVTNTAGGDVHLELPALPDPRLFFYGVQVRPAP